MARPVRRFALTSQSDGGSTLMFDLYLGLMALLLVSVIGFAISVRFPLGSSKRQGLLLMVVVLLAMALYAIFLRDSVFLAWHWDDDGICRQTTSATCTAACAATVLASHGIPATEQEMAELCSTRRGTIASTWPIRTSAENSGRRKMCACCSEDKACGWCGGDDPRTKAATR